ncbi:hypothetical protein X979_5911 [Burkholderia pseudomallei MSHR7527]|nr:hypothetical protein X979_5911 [Burkholderia pseudomallei MSHR7527]
MTDLALSGNRPQRCSPTEFISLGWGRRLNAHSSQIPTKIPTGI